MYKKREVADRNVLGLKFICTELCNVRTQISRVSQASYDLSMLENAFENLRFVNKIFPLNFHNFLDIEPFSILHHKYIATKTSKARFLDCCSQHSIENEKHELISTSRISREIHFEITQIFYFLRTVNIEMTS